MNYVWTPIDRLNLTAGLQYNTYWSVDDFINNRIDEGKEGTKRLNERIGVTAEYKEILTPEERIIYTQYKTLRKAYFGVSFGKKSTAPEEKNIPNKSNSNIMIWIVNTAISTSVAFA